MDIFYTLNIIDFITRISLVGIFFLIFIKLQRIDKDIIKSRIFLKYEELIAALRYVLILAPLFIIASVLEYPEFRFIYGEEVVHLIQDLLLLFFQIGIIYFLVVVYKVLNLPGR